jgi:hypothetical protein
VLFGGTHWVVLARTAGRTQVCTGVHTPLTRTSVLLVQATAVTVSVVVAEVGPQPPTLPCDAVIVLVPGPLMVTVLPAMVATAGLLLV